MRCPYCDAENRDGVRFCSNCGKMIGSATSNTGATSAPTLANTTPGGGISSRSLNPGATLQGGRYVIKQVLGQGGMGAALLATDKRLDNKQVVIKELLSDSSDPVKFKEDERNFNQEVMTLAHLDHPLIPNVTDKFEEGNHYFMVQEYAEGENLEDRLNRLKQPLKERDVLVYASQVLDVLEYLAQQTPPIVHRDIKPANIIIGEKDKRAHLVDFGIARADIARNAQRKQTSALGTPGYAPLEQYQGNADPRSDLYALGATMHHLLTNRDPRDYAPFSYPLVTTVNPQLSKDVERVLAKAVNNDVTQRYQSATQMRRDIDEILFKRFGVSGQMSSYTLGTSGPMATVPSINTASTVAAGTGMAHQAPTVNQPPLRVQQAPVTPLPPPPYQAGGMYTTPPRQPRKRSNVGLNFFLFILVIILLFALGFGAVNYFRSKSGTGGGGSTSTPNTTVTTNIPASGIGVTAVGSNEHIGISDGTFAFDTTRISGDTMKQAAQKLQSGDTGAAQSLWSQALVNDSNNAEALIYLEDQRVLSSGDPYITIVAATMLTGDSALVSVGRDDLQGVYVAQKEYNDGSLLPGGYKVRVLIANSGSQTSYAPAVAQQIVQLAKVDKTFVGVLGWPYSSRTVAAVGILAKAQIPMISQTASSDQLTGASSYFFRVAPPNKEQAKIGAKYAEQTLHAKNVALFVDQTDSYSQSLAAAFQQQFTADGNKIVATEKYTVGKPNNFVQLLNDAEKYTPDLIYFSGYASDASVLLTDLPTTGPFANLQVLGGDALYELGGYQSSAHAASVRMRFTTFAYPDEWNVLCAGGQQFACTSPRFFADYSNFYDPNRSHVGSPYGYTRADGDVILSYDAMQTILTASSSALSAKPSITPDSLLQALRTIKGANAIQGVSGQIAFNAQGDPVNKALVILKIVQGGFFTLDSVQGCFQKGAC